MENTIQFFTDEQTRSVAEFAHSLYEEDRAQRRKNIKTSEEFKTKLKEIKNSDFGTKLENDKQILIDNFNKEVALLETLNSAFDKDGAQSILQLLRHPHYYIGGCDKDTISLPKFNEAETKILYSYAVKYFAEENKSIEQLKEKIEEMIQDKLEQETTHAYFTFEKNLWDQYKHIKAIVATMPACDESQAVDKIIEKMPYDEVNNMVESS